MPPYRRVELEYHDTQFSLDLIASLVTRMGWQHLITFLELDKDFGFEYLS